MFTLPGVVSPERILCFIRLRFTLGFFYANLLWTTPVYSQRSLTYFGPLVDLPLGYSPTGIAVTASAGSAPAQIVLLSQEDALAHLHTVNAKGQVIESGTFPFSTHGDVFLGVDMDGDGTQEFVGLSEDGTSVSIGRMKGGAVKEEVVRIETPSQRLAIADINNDKRKDILLYGKKCAGISPLLGKADGSYAQGPVLFPEVSISDLQTTDLNGDGITDVLLLDWLSNRLSLFYGIGRGIFSEQVALDLPGEPAGLAITPVTKHRTMRAAVTFQETGQIAVYTGNATGEFEQGPSLSGPSGPSRIAFVDVNGDQLLDIVTSSEEALIVYPGAQANQFSSPVVYGIGSGISSWSVADLDGDGKRDVAVTDLKTKRLVLLGNANGSGGLSMSRQYAVGAQPRGLAVRDFNGDGLVDVAVANHNSSSISVLFNRGGGKLDGQQTIHTAEGPAYVRATSTQGPVERTLVLSHTGVDMVTVVHLAEEPSATESFTIPTGANPFVVFAKQDSSSQMLEMLVRYTNSRDGSLSLSLFEQIGGGQFLERSLRPTLPAAIAALTVDDLSRQGEYDLVFVTHDRSERRSTLSIARSAHEFDFKTIQPLLSFSDSTSSVRSIIAGDVNGDEIRDIVLLFGPPGNGLGFVYGKGRGEFGDSLDVIRGVQAVNEDAVVMKDLDGDGRRDIALMDGGRNAIVVLYGRIDGRFDSPVTIAPISRNGSFRVASMTAKPAQDLIISNGTRGTVSILYDPFRRP